MEFGQGDLSIVKGKRSKRQRRSAPAMASSRKTTSPVATTSTAEFSYSKEDEQMANCLLLLAQSGQRPVETGTDARATRVVSKRGPYECKTANASRCSKLGGHRGSHKKPKAGEEKEKASMAAVMQQQGRRGAAGPWLG
ncbi:hypothetical protein EJ110_NYTH06132 [Nymphaea thermarum]|nr:hypothetical protein EJ110_NYTH06132 [Nymphaea thermarum]